MPDTYDLSPVDRDLLIRTVIGEAGNDPASAPGVAHVVLNRLSSGNYGSTIPQILFSPNQFEAWDRQGPQLLSYTSNSPAYQNAAKIVDEALAGGKDPTGGAQRFYSPIAQAALGRRPPAWDDGTGVMIGKQKFFGGSEPDMISRFMPAQSAAPSAMAAVNAPIETAEPDLISKFMPGAAAPAVPSQTIPSGSFVTYVPELGHEVQFDPSGNKILPPQPSASPEIPALDPYAPIGQQLATIHQQGMQNLSSAFSGILPSIGQDFSNALALAGRGIGDIQAGNILPTMPSWNPRTWTPGGALETALGATAAPLAPLTGTISQLIERPTLEATGSPEIASRAGLVANMLAAPAIGRLSSGALSGLGNTFIGRLDPETAALAQTGRQQFGIPINAAQMSASPAVRFLSSALDRLPFSGAPAQRELAQSAVNRAVSNTIGENAEKLTPNVMVAAKKRIGGVFDTVAQNTTLNVDRQFLQDIHDTLNNALTVLPKTEAEPLLKTTNNIIEKIDPNSKTISGETYQALTRTGTPLDRLTDSSNSNIAYYAQGLRNALDDALERSASPEMSASLSQAKRQYRNLMTIKPLVAKAPTGDISPALLQGAVNVNTGNALAFGGGGDLGTIARIGQRFLKEAPSSGTAERLHALHMLQSLVEAPLTVPAGMIGNAVLGRIIRSNPLAEALLARSLRSYAPPSSLFPLALTTFGSQPSLQSSFNALSIPHQSP